MISPVKIWRNEKKYARLIGQTGRIISWTLIRVAPDGFDDQSPYPLAIIALDKGQNITAQIVDYDLSQLHIGQPVVMVIRKGIAVAADEVIPYVIKAKVLAFR